jgi:sucrose phosphorylase
LVGDQLHDHLAFLYGEERAPELTEQFERVLQRFEPPGREGVRSDKDTRERFSEKDAILITYGDMVSAQGQPPLATLADFLQQRVRDVISTVHLLPFYPYSSDDGFAVVDYLAVDPALGSWQDVRHMGRHFRLMFDAVINHVSAQSEWFQAFLRDEAPYRDYFKVVQPGADLSQVFRPRALPLLTPVQTAAGEKLVWTTFSDDQVDLNYENPAVLLDVVRTLLFYVAQGAEFLRLDAIAFMWKAEGTSSIHLPQTHRIIQLLRTVLDRVAPHVVMITETNVPHEQNVSYFGDGYNEAQMVYNFSLPPLTLHAFHSGKATELSRWASSLRVPSPATTFLNFLASHDGVGLTPLQGILSEKEVQALAERVQALGGYVSYRQHGDGTQSPYELNVNYLDALGDLQRPGEAPQRVAARFLAAQAMMLALQGVPGIYFHSLFGSRNWQEGVEQTGRVRSINRQKLQREPLERELDTAGSLRQLVFDGYRRLLQQRTAHPAFHPSAEQQVLLLDEALFALLRGSPGDNCLLCLHNVSGEERRVSVALGAYGLPANGQWRDLLSGQRFVAKEGRLEVVVGAYGVLWLSL